MGLNAAGLDHILSDAAKTVYAAIGSGPLAANENSTARILLTIGASSGGVRTVSNVPLAFTGTASAAATHLLLFSASTAGTFYGYKALSGDQAYNASGAYSVTALTLTGTSPA